MILFWKHERDITLILIINTHNSVHIDKLSAAREVHFDRVSAAVRMSTRSSDVRQFGDDCYVRPSSIRQCCIFHDLRGIQRKQTLSDTIHISTGDQHTEIKGTGYLQLRS